MKKILILFLFIPLFSCNDWLTVEPEDSVTFVNYFKNEEELKALHNSMASYMKNICIGKQPYFYNALDADNIEWTYQGFWTLDPETYLPEESMVLDVNWAGFYDAIYIATG